MRKLTLGLGVAALLTFGAFGQVLGGRVDSLLGRENVALVLINTLELTPAQMKELLKLVDELMPLRNEIVAMPDKLHEDLVKFTGKPQELRELLSNYQKDLREKLQNLEDKFTAGLKKILTVEQWERLTRGILSEGKAAPQPRFGWRGAPRATNLRLDLGRGLTLVRFLPDLRDALAAKIEALEK
jgi:hypothetical protein